MQNIRLSVKFWVLVVLVGKLEACFSIYYIYVLCICTRAFLEWICIEHSCCSVDNTAVCLFIYMHIHIFTYIYIYIYMCIYIYIERERERERESNLFVTYHLSFTRMKEKPLEENAVLPHTETKKPKYTFISM